MEQQQRCRICLADNVRMFECGKNMHKLYEMLTNIPFVTVDKRPTVACFYCYAKLKQCYQLQQQCLQAEKLFAQMINEPKLLINHGFSNEFVNSPIENIGIVDDVINGVATQDEIPEPPTLFEVQVTIEHEEEPESEDLQLENKNNGYSNGEDTLQHHSGSDLNMTKFKIEIEENQELLGKTRKASDSTNTSTTTKQNQVSLRKNIKDMFPEEQNKYEKPETKVVKTTEKVVFKEPPKCNLCDRGFISKSNLLMHIRTHVGVKSYKCNICQRRCRSKGDFLKHIRTHVSKKNFKCNIC